MSHQSIKGINREGLDAAFEADEAQKSNLILSAQLLREQYQDEAAIKFAQAAAIEERLADRCEEKGLVEKAFIHRFSAASCWAQAGNFYQAIALCDSLLTHADLPEPLRRRIQSYDQTLHSRRSQWYEELMLETTTSEK